MNIGLIEGGRAPNVIPDHAVAHLLFAWSVRPRNCGGRSLPPPADKAEAHFMLEIPYMEFATVPGIETMIAAFTTDIPALTSWGKPLLIGPARSMSRTPKASTSKSSNCWKPLISTRKLPLTCSAAID